MPLPDEIHQALVVGAGTMGPGIALVYAIAGHEVDLVDNDPAALDRAADRIRAGLDSLVEEGALQAGALPAILGRINRTTDLAAVAPRADIVTEAIAEDPQAKQQLFQQLDALLKPEAILASNTSGLNVFELLKDLIPLRLPNLIIHHYFLPATIIPLVEVVVGPETDPETTRRSVSLLESLGKAPVVLRRFRDHFIVNRFQIALAGVVAELLADGVATAEEIDRAVKHSLGIRLPVVGVAQTLDFTGMELVARLLRHAGQDPSFFETLVAEGRLGARSGRGLYDYDQKSLVDLERQRDRKYRAIAQLLREINAFEAL